MRSEGSADEVGDTPGSPGASAHEALMQFLYLAPIGLVQAAPDGSVSLINPMAAQLLMPLSPLGDLGNLFDALQGVAPQLRALVDGTTADGIVVEDLRIALPPGPGTPQMLALNLMRLDSATLMASLADVSNTVERERRMVEQLHDATHTDGLTALPNRDSRFRAGLVYQPFEEHGFDWLGLFTARRQFFGTSRLSRN